MIKEFVCSKIKQYLQTYIEEIQDEDLLLSLYEGYAEINNIRLSRSFLDSCESSFKIEDIHINKIRLTIPWTSFYTSSIHLQLDGVYICIGDLDTSTASPHDEVSSEISSTTNAETACIESEPSISNPSSMFQFLTIAGNNIDISITNFHIQFKHLENQFSSVGCTASELSLSYGKKEDRQLHCDDSNVLHKILLIREFSLYCTSSTSKIELLQDASIQIEFSCDLREKRIHSPIHILSFLTDQLSEEHSTVLINYLSERNSVLYNTNRIHSESDLLGILNENLQKYIPEDVLKSAVPTLFPLIKYEPPFLILRGTVEHVHATFHVDAIRYIKNTMELFAPESSPPPKPVETSTNSTQPLTLNAVVTYLVTRVFSSYSSFLVTLFTFICLPLWLYFSFLQAVGSLLLVGTGMLYYQRFFGNRQEEVPYLPPDEERELHSNVIEVSVSVQDVDLNVFEGRCDTNLILNDLNVKLSSTKQALGATIELGTCSGLLCNTQSPCCMITYKQDEIMKDIRIEYTQCSLHLPDDIMGVLKLLTELGNACIPDTTLSTNLSVEGCVSHLDCYWLDKCLSLSDLSFSPSHLLIQSIKATDVKSTDVLIQPSTDVTPQCIIHWKPLQINFSSFHCIIPSDLVPFLFTLSSTSAYLEYSVSANSFSVLLLDQIKLSGSSCAISVTSDMTQLSVDNLTVHENDLMILHSPFTKGFIQSSPTTTAFSFAFDNLEACLYVNTLTTLKQCIRKWDLLCTVPTEEENVLSEITESEVGVSSTTFDIHAPSLQVLLMDEVHSFCSSSPSLYSTAMKAKAQALIDMKTLSCHYAIVADRCDAEFTAEDVTLQYLPNQPSRLVISVGKGNEVQTVSHALEMHYYASNASLAQEWTMDMDTIQLEFSPLVYQLPTLSSFLPSNTFQSTASSMIWNKTRQSYILSAVGIEARVLDMTVLLKGSISFDYEGSQLQSYSIDLSTVSIDTILSTTIKWEMAGESVFISTAPILCRLRPNDLQRLYSLYQHVSSSSSSTQSMSLVIPSIQLYLYSSSCPACRISIENCCVESSSSSNMKGSLSMKLDYYREDIIMWESVFTPLRLECEMEGVTTMFNIPQFCDVTLTQSFLQTLSSLFEETNETEVKEEFMTISNQSCFYFHTIVYEEHSMRTTAETYESVPGETITLSFPSFPDDDNSSQWKVDLEGEYFKHSFSLYSHSPSIVNYSSGLYLVIQSVLNQGKREIVIGSNIQLTNHLEIPLLCNGCTIPSNHTQSIPVSFIQDSFSLGVDSQDSADISLTSLLYPTRDGYATLEKSKYSLRLHTSEKELAVSKDSIILYTIHISPCLQFENLLPVSITMILYDSYQSYVTVHLKSSEKKSIFHIPSTIANCQVCIQLEGKGENLTTYSLGSYHDNYLNFDNAVIHYKYYKTDYHFNIISIFADYWIQNQTDTLLSIYMDNRYYYAPINSTLLLSFRNPKHEVVINSNKVSFDLLKEDMELTTLTHPVQVYSITRSPPIHSCSSIIGICPRYLITNQTSHMIGVTEDGEFTQVIINPGETVHFNWTSSFSRQHIRIYDVTTHSTLSESLSFSMHKVVSLSVENKKEQVEVYSVFSEGQYHMTLYSKDSNETLPCNPFFTAIFFKGIGFDFIDASHQELIFSYIHGMNLQIQKDETGLLDCQLQVNTLQVDSMTPNAHFPVIFGNNTHPLSISKELLLSGKSVLPPSNPKPALFISIQRLPSIICEVVLNESNLCIELPVLSRIMKFLKELPSLRNSSQKPELLPIEQLEIDQIQLKLSCYSPTSFAYPNRSQMPSLLNAIVDAAGRLILNTENTPFNLDAVSLQDKWMSVQQLVTLLKNHYSKQIGNNIHNLIGSANILGNPQELIGHVGDGIQSFIHESASGAAKGPVEFVNGIGKGTQQFLSKTTYGLLNSAKHITNALGDSVESLTFSDNYKANRESGKKGLRQGVQSGVHDFVENVKQGSLEGVGKGMIGMITQPLGGFIDDTSNLLNKMQTSADKSPKLERIRPPRFIFPSPELREYSSYLAYGKEAMRSISDSYVCHVPTNNNKVLIVFSQNKLFAVDDQAKTVLWEALYSKVDVLMQKQCVILKNGERSFSCFVHHKLFHSLLPCCIQAVVKSPKEPTFLWVIQRLLTALHYYPCCENPHILIHEPTIQWITIEAVHLVNADIERSTWNISGCTFSWKVILNVDELLYLNDIIFNQMRYSIGVHQISSSEKLSIIANDVNLAFQKHPELCIIREIDWILKSHALNFGK